MDIKTYQIEAGRTCPQLANENDDLHMVLGMVTEAGEIADVYKKEIAYGKQVDYINLKEELGDLMWYIANMCNIQDWNLEDILQKNIDKLKVRYPDKFTEQQALNRNLDAERQSLH